MILADAHVHIYDCFNISSFLNSSVVNFSAEAARIGFQAPFVALLLLTEGSNANWFKRFITLIDDSGDFEEECVPGWSFYRTREKCSVKAVRSDGKSLLLIAGRQIITSERLEVLAVATEKMIEDGASLETTVQQVMEADALPVIPWGAGKWIGRRGSILTKYLNESKGTGLFLGDNGGRPGFWSRPSHFRLAEEKRIRILPGSDPLPFDRESEKPGSFGFWMPYTLDAEYPARGMKELLLSEETEIKAYGDLELPLRFFRNQLVMQLRRRLHRRCGGRQ